MKESFKRIVKGLVLTLLFVAPSSAATIVKANNSTALNLGASWVGGVPPTTSDIIHFDSTINPAISVSPGAITVTGITVTNPTGDLTINATSSNLTIGSSGVDVSGAGSRFILNTTVNLNADQTWNFATGRQLLLNTGNVLNTNGHNLTINSVSALDVRGAQSFGSNVTITGAGGINFGFSTGTRTLSGANTFNGLNISTGRVTGATIGNFGVTSNFGSGGTNSPIVLGGTGSDGVMEYTGSTASTNRTVTRHGGSAASGIDVTTAGETLTIS